MVDYIPVEYKTYFIVAELLNFFLAQVEFGHNNKDKYIFKTRALRECTP